LNTKELVREVMFNAEGFDDSISELINHLEERLDSLKKDTPEFDYIEETIDTLENALDGVDLELINDLEKEFPEDKPKALNTSVA